MDQKINDDNDIIQNVNIDSWIVIDCPSPEPEPFRSDVVSVAVNVVRLT